MFLTVLFVVIVGVLSVIYYKLKRHYEYFERRGIISEKSSFPYGNVKDADVKEALIHVHQRLYNKTKDKAPLFGMFTFTKPGIVLTDLDLIKNILIKDFQFFQDRSKPSAADQSQLSHHLLFLTGQRWKTLRQKLSPTFTSGKMKFMFPTLVKISKEFESTLMKLVDEDPVFEMKEVIARFTTDIIGECAFGIECNSLKDPDAEFRQMGQKIFSSINRITFLRFVNETYPSIGRIMQKYFRKNSQVVGKFFIKTVKETIKFRDEHNIRRNDFFDLLLQMRDNNEIGGITFEEIASQAFLFFIAGFETSSTTVSSALFELVHNQKIQDQLRQEIVEILEKHNNEITYEAIQEMTYLDQVIKETLRLHPPVGTLRRYAVKDYHVPNTDIIIEKGSDVYVPLYSLQHDPEYYPDPYKFDPSRFDPSITKSRHSSLFLSFGDGPRNCIGERFGLMQSKIAMVVLIKNLRLHPTDRLKYPLQINLGSPIYSIKDGLWLRLETLK